MSKRDISDYYDELHRWTAKDQSFQTFSGFENDTIHRFLIDEDTGAFSPETIYKIMAPYLPIGAIERGLDAGCGYGGTCLYGARQWGGMWTGITISPEQISHATSIANARGLGDRVTYHLCSYDAPLGEPFDVIIAIESLIHSIDPAKTLANLAKSLKRGSRLLIADDMPATRMSAETAGYLERFKRAWRCPIAPTAQTWVGHATSAGLRVIAEHDLSHLQKPRSEPDLDRALADLESKRGEKDAQGFMRLADAEIGGLHLERLHGRGAVKYMLLVLGRADEPQLD